MNETSPDSRLLTSRISFRQGRSNVVRAKNRRELLDRSAFAHNSVAPIDKLINEARMS